MTPYILIYGLVIGISIIHIVVSEIYVAKSYDNRRGNARKAPKLPWIVLLVLVAFETIRANVGTDYRTYVKLFNKYDISESWPEQILDNVQEPGFTFIIFILKLVYDDPIIMFGAVAVLSTLPTYFVIRKYATDGLFALYLFLALGFYTSSFNGARQAIAVSLLLLAYVSLRGGYWSPFRYWSVSALAATIHLTALPAALMMFLINDMSSKDRRQGRGRILSMVVALGSVLVLMSFADASSLVSRYEGYLEGEESGIGRYLVALFYLILIIWVRLNSDRKRDRDLYFLILIGIALSLVGTQWQVLGRLSGYFLIFSIILVPSQIPRDNRYPYIQYIVVLAATVYGAFELLSFGDLIPYQTIFSQS